MMLVGERVRIERSYFRSWCSKTLHHTCASQAKPNMSARHCNSRTPNVEGLDPWNTGDKCSVPTMHLHESKSMVVLDSCEDKLPARMALARAGFNSC